MLNVISFFLNLPYTITGIIISLLSIPTSFGISKRHFALVFNVNSFWWGLGGHYSKARAMTIGHTILLSPKIEAHDLEHELIHVRQYIHAPLIFPILYYYQTLKYGYRKNKYEDEAYIESGSSYRGK